MNYRIAYRYLTSYILNSGSYNKGNGLYELHFAFGVMRFEKKHDRFVFVLTSHFHQWSWRRGDDELDVVRGRGDIS